MLDEKEARLSASKSPVLREGMRLGDAQELRDGWYFPLSSRGVIGCNGIIVNKRTGRRFHLGLALPVERDLELYDRGYQFDWYDLVILRVHDHKQTAHALSRLHLDVLEPRTEWGTVRQVPRRMTGDELAAKLERLPCILPAVRLYFEAEALERARAAGWFVFELREHVPSTGATPFVRGGESGLD
jgi:hypothetical protein